MFKLIGAILLLLPLAVFSQQQDTIVYGDKVFFTGKVYLDSVAVDINKIFLDPDNIQSVETRGGKQSVVYSHAPKAVFITRKNKTPLIGLGAFIKNSESLKDEPQVTIMVNKRVIEHPEEYFIEETAIAKVDILLSAEEARGDHLWRPPSIIITLKPDK